MQRGVRPDALVVPGSEALLRLPLELAGNNETPMAVLSPSDAGVDFSDNRRTSQGLLSSAGRNSAGFFSILRKFAQRVREGRSGNNFSSTNVSDEPLFFTGGPVPSPGSGFGDSQV
jgi:hypothetical protein